MKYSLLLILISFPSFAQLVQKKYPGVAGKPSDLLVIDNASSVIIPNTRFKDYLSKQIGVAGKSSNYVMKNNEQVIAYPYIVVPENEYELYMKKQVGLVGKKANHVSIDGQETLLISSKDMNTSLSSYPGIAGSPANHVVIDGQEFVFVPKSQYLDFISQYKGLSRMPSNYVFINNKLVVVVPENEEDKEVEGAEVNKSPRSNVKEQILKPVHKKVDSNKATKQ